jgi:hypothetical protein
MLSALAHAPAPLPDRPAPATEENKPAKSTDMAGSSAVSDEDMSVPTATEAALPVDPALEGALKKDSSKTDVVPERLQPETANGLVARLRRQFMEGLPEGREEGRGEEERGTAAPAESTSSPAVETRRSALEEVRFRLREFRTELLARAGRN